MFAFVNVGVLSNVHLRIVSLDLPSEMLYHDCKLTDYSCFYYKAGTTQKVGRFSKINYQFFSK
jgi:hypothetical protein